MPVHPRRRVRGLALPVVVLAAVSVAACVTRRVPEAARPAVSPLPPPVPSAVRGDSAAATPRPREAGDVPRDAPPRLRTEGIRDVRVALATAAHGAVVTATGSWRLFDARDAVLVRASANDPWTIERAGRRLRARRAGAGATSWSDERLTLRADADDSYGVFAGRRYRGAIRLLASDTGLVVVNVLPVEQYLRGVVPLEIGGVGPADQAAVEAQAVAARSYAFARLADVDARASRNVSFDLFNGVADQVYGGLDAERPFGDRAIVSTAGLVLTYAGRVVSAPYSSSCGGETASPEEVWRASAEPFLRRVSDRVPGTADRYYCDIAPRFAWVRSFTSDELDAAVRSYLKNYVAVPSGGPGRVQGVVVAARTPSGRVGRLAVATDRGAFELRGNDTRYVLRTPGGEILNSTFFTVEAARRRDGTLEKLTVRGNGYGHGIGMCQWGAIGRARAGDSYRAILAAYYPGTTVRQVD